MSNKKPLFTFAGIVKVYVISCIVTWALIFLAIIGRIVWTVAPVLLIPAALFLAGLVYLFGKEDDEEELPPGVTGECTYEDNCVFKKTKTGAAS
jgi:hypothetical protein